MKLTFFYDHVGLRILLLHTILVITMRAIAFSPRSTPIMAQLTTKIPQISGATTQLAIDPEILVITMRAIVFSPRSTPIMAQLPCYGNRTPPKQGYQPSL